MISKIILTKSILFSFVLSIISSCQIENNGKLNLFVSIQPQRFFVEKIAGSKADVSVFVKSGMSPENFEPLPSQLIKISNADLYFTVGFQFEERIVNNISSENPALHIIKTETDIPRNYVQSYEDIFQVTANHDEKDNHHNELKDPHIWLSPELVKKQSKTIYESLIKIDSSNSEYYKNNYLRFVREIDSVQNIITSNLQGLKKRNLLVYHPAWGYFCKQFNLKQIPIEIEGKEPGIRELSKILNFIKTNDIKYILAETQNSSPALISVTKELGIRIIRHDPLSENYFKNIIVLSEIIKENE